MGPTNDTPHFSILHTDKESAQRSPTSPTSHHQGKPILIQWQTLPPAMDTSCAPLPTPPTSLISPWVPWNRKLGETGDFNGLSCGTDMWMKGTKEEIAGLARFFSSMMHEIKYILDQSGDSLHYLDNTVFKDDASGNEGILVIKPYIKPTKLRTLLHYSSCHPMKHLVKGKLVCLIRCSSSPN